MLLQEWLSCNCWMLFVTGIIQFILIKADNKNKSASLQVSLQKSYKKSQSEWERMLIGSHSCIIYVLQSHTVLPTFFFSLPNMAVWMDDFIDLFQEYSFFHVWIDALAMSFWMLTMDLRRSDPQPSGPMWANHDLWNHWIMNITGFLLSLILGIMGRA